MRIRGHGQAAWTGRVEWGGGGTSTYTTPSEVCVPQLRTLLYFWKQMAQDYTAYSADTR